MPCVSEYVMSLVPFADMLDRSSNIAGTRPHTYDTSPGHGHLLNLLAMPVTMPRPHLLTLSKCHLFLSEWHSAPTYSTNIQLQRRQ